ncbi:APC family permease, partial [Streptomyces sp. NPDC005568]|uniref:APC family permease n=1 Tax=Streptomyces sp. NPDC005568 TaxID=3156887 RepID=UPI0033B3F1C2
MERPTAPSRGTTTSDLDLSATLRTERDGPAFDDRGTRPRLRGSGAISRTLAVRPGPSGERRPDHMDTSKSSASAQPARRGPQPDDRTPKQSPLNSALSTPLLYFFILGDVLGAGVYVLVGQIVAASGGAVWVPLSVALCLAMLTAGSYAELATKYPRAGGASHYTTRAYGPFAGFLAGYCMLAAGIVSVAALARGFAGDYLTAFVSLPVAAVVIVFLAALALLNARGIKESTRANVVATVIEVGGLLIVVVLGAWIVLRGDGHVDALTDLGTPQKGAAAAVLSGAVLAYYSFVGFETSVNVAEETRDPVRSYPRALFGALGTAGLVYVLVGLAATAAVLAVVRGEPLLQAVVAVPGRGVEARAR